MADVLPLAIAIAASPFPVIPAILLLFTPRARLTATSFLLGWFVGVAAVTAVFVLVADVIEAFDEPPAWASWARLVIGIALVVWGLTQWRGRAKPKPAPAWMTTLSTAGPRRALSMGLLLSAANPKIMVLAAAGGLAIGADIVGLGQQALTVVAFALVGSLSVAIPVLAFLILGDRVLTPLGSARDWLERNNSAVMAVVFIVIGLLLIVKGATAL